MMTAVVGIWFPQWPLQHALWKQPELKGRPVILHSPLTERTPRVVDCSLAAHRRGVRIGMAVAEARALIAGPSIPAMESASRSRSTKNRSLPFFAEHDPAGDRAMLKQLANGCEKYSPIYGVEDCENPECLFLDVTGSCSLFGGEQSLAEQIQDDFQEQGWNVRVAVTPTIGASWAVAHAISRANQAITVPEEGLEETLDGLPVSVLRLPDSIVHTLSELGIHGIGQLRRLPRERLPSRFGLQILQRLDQALGNAAELITVEHPQEPLSATWAAQEPFRDRLVLLEVCRHLLERMLAPLQDKRRGIRRLLCQLHSHGGRPCELSVGLVSPSNSASHVNELLELQLERVAWEEEITLVRLEAIEVAPLEERARDLFDDSFGADHSCELRHLLERLSNRLGADAVVRARYIPDPQPELAVAYQPWITSENSSKRKEARIAPADENTVDISRPLRLLETPQPIDVSIAHPGIPNHFFWKQKEHQVRHVWGPERIETGWWRGTPICRDYYRVEVTSGERYWLFQTAEGWFLHGIY